MWSTIHHLSSSLPPCVLPFCSTLPPSLPHMSHPPPRPLAWAFWRFGSKKRRTRTRGREDEDEGEKGRKPTLPLEPSSTSSSRHYLSPPLRQKQPGGGGKKRDSNLSKGKEKGRTRRTARPAKAQHACLAATARPARQTAAGRRAKGKLAPCAGTNNEPTDLLVLPLPLPLPPSSSFFLSCYPPHSP